VDSGRWIGRGGGGGGRQAGRQAERNTALLVPSSSSLLDRGPGESPKVGDSATRVVRDKDDRSRSSACQTEWESE